MRILDNGLKFPIILERKCEITMLNLFYTLSKYKIRILVHK